MGCLDRLRLGGCRGCSPWAACSSDGSMCSVYLQYAWLFVYIAAAFAVVVGAGLPLRLHLKPSFDPSLAMLQLGVRYREFCRPWKLDSSPRTGARWAQ